MTDKITSLEGLTPITGKEIANIYVYEVEEFYLADDVRALLASQAEPADEIERRTEEISVAHANPVGRSRAALLHDVECLLGHIALLRGAAPPLSQPHQAVVADERAGWEAAATAISDRAAGHDQMGNFTEADECRTCVSMLRDLKPAAPLPPSAPVGQALDLAAPILTDEQIKELAFGLYHSDYQDDPHGYDIELARRVERALHSAPGNPAAPDQAYLPGWERGIATVTINGHQLREALEFINPGGDDEPDELDNDLTFGTVKHADEHGEATTGLCCWNDDSDGVLPLDGDDQGFDRNAERITREAGLGNGKINPDATSILDVFVDEDTPVNPVSENGGVQ